MQKNPNPIPNGLVTAATKVAERIQDTPKGVRLDLGHIYYYPNGHGNLYLGDGTNIPFEHLQDLAVSLLYPLMRAGRSRKGRP